MKLILIALLFMHTLVASAQISINGPATPAGAYGTDFNLTETAPGSGIWYGTFSLGVGELKIRKNASWSPVYWSASTAIPVYPIGTAVTNQIGIQIPSAGSYDITFNEATRFTTFTKQLSIIGLATPHNNLTADYPLSKTGNPYLYTSNVDLTVNPLKFRLNSDWGFSWGSTSFPTGTGVLVGPDIPVSPAALYTVSFNIATKAYSFTAGGVGSVGIGISAPAEKLDVYGNIKTTGEIKPNGTAGLANQVLTSNGNGTMQWAEAKTNGSVGFGSWGDCSTSNISEYNPVTDVESNISDFFGFSVSISGNYAIVGAYLDDVGTNTGQGSASIYQFNGTNWEFMQKMTDATGAANDNFGTSVSISGNYAIVGANEDDVGANNDQGSASIYQLTGGTWTFMQKITDPTGAAGDYFGNSVSISGNYAIVGACFGDVGANEDQGSASIYQLTGGTWTLMQKMTDATGASSDQFGYSVSISGNYVIVGAQGDEVGTNTEQGSASIYQFNGTNWVLMQKITDATGAEEDKFGHSVSISGNYAIVGAYWDDFVANTDQGSASIYQFNGTNWVFLQKMTDATGDTSDEFGCSVSISGNYAIVGACRDYVGANANQGSATIYQRIGLGWQKVQQVIDPGGNFYDTFGYATAIDGLTNRFVIGAYGFGNSSGKAVFGKLNF